MAKAYVQSEAEPESPAVTWGRQKGQSSIFVDVFRKHWTKKVAGYFEVRHFCSQI